MSDTILEVNNISKKYSRNLALALKYGYRDSFRRALYNDVSHSEPLRPGEFWALRDITFNLRRGDRLGVLGRNGAGKSTLMKIIAGISAPDTGTVYLGGSIDQMIELTSGFHPMMTGYQNVRLRARMMGISEEQFKNSITELIEFTELADAIHSPVRYYSSGMKARLGFGVSTLRKPDILIVDEALAVGDLDFRLKCYEFISDKLRDTVLIFVSHSLAHIKRFCNLGMYLEKGRVKHYGDPQEAIELYQNTPKSRDTHKITGLNADAVEFSIGTALEIGAENDVPTIESGQSLSITIRPCGINTDCVISINLTDDTGRALFEFRNTHHLKPNRLTSEIVCETGALFLNAGFYRINISVHAMDGYSLLSYTPWQRFKVVGELIGHAPIQPPGTWSCRDTNIE